MVSVALGSARANSGITFRPDANTVLWLYGQDDPHSAVIRDRSGYGNNGAIIGATWVQNGKGLWELIFDGNDDQVTIPHNTSLDASTELTILSWINPAGDYTTRNTIASKRVAGTSASNYHFYLMTTTGLLQYYNGTAEYAGASAPTTGVYSLVGITVKHSTPLVTFYINGIAAGTQAAGLGATNADTVKIGSHSAAPVVDMFEGNIALVRIFTRILSAGEVAHIYNQERHLFQ